ncbi:hypothetical protein P152DRAFT_320249 [Eremomyces bilateralis CBS 781.70]|uniref:Secreted protein n=1 Tax=Eremomyces bilateralis CBS 781.70 TaxID=1392243 RepID=A0A6G1G603_9PEZI|nr:uncharacterized protein P152DRAFT_320249 [Eremomyces bilateralis CBS 781.70]KAF1813458.1 hypothetical protein P152DRAFT_320249 [Eremomyces bilateralis CBS 781.70]
MKFLERLAFVIVMYRLIYIGDASCGGVTPHSIYSRHAPNISPYILGARHPNQYHPNQHRNDLQRDVSRYFASRCGFHTNLIVN